MTCLVALGTPGFSLVAADTRLNFEHDGIRSHEDGPVPPFQFVTGQTFNAPHCLRKIRKLHNCWVAGTGDFIPIELAFAALEEAHIDADLMWDYWLRKRQSLREKATSMTMFAPGPTTLLAAFSANAHGVKLFDFESAEPRSAMYVTTMPPDSSQAEKDQVNGSFAEDVGKAYRAGNQYEILRSALRVLIFANERCNSVGPLAEIGFSLPSNGRGERHFHVFGNARVLLSLDDFQLRREFHPVDDERGHEGHPLASTCQ